MIIAVLLTAAAMVTPLILNIIQFVHTITKLRNERHEVFLRFCMTEKEEVLLLKRRLDDAMRDEEEEGEDAMNIHTV